MAATACYAALLAPVLGLFQNGPQLVADRYSYLATIGLAVVAGGGLSRWYAQRGAAARIGASALAAGIIAMLAVLTWRQCHVWRDTESLWTHVHRHDPNSAHGLHGYGMVLEKAGRHEEALALYRRAIGIMPHLHAAHIASWMLMQSRGERGALESALHGASASGNPVLAADAHVWLGWLAADGPEGEAAAERAFRTALRVHPRNAPAHLYLAMMLETRGRADESARHAREAARLDPGLVTNVIRQSQSSAAGGNTAEALRFARLALVMDPRSLAAQELLEELGRPSTSPDP
jgi:tetratricopeptide (TPR) repeat protein